MDEYRVPAGYGEREFIEKRSRFIGRVWHTETEEEAVARIKEMREKHWDATHNVYAYIIRDGGIMRYSDDGEPQGTSGMPVLNVFRSAGIYNVCCVVTRYFGGVLLGAGGLVRAYSNTASIALEAAGIAVMRRANLVEISCAYSPAEKVRREIVRLGACNVEVSYGENVTFSAVLPIGTEEQIELRVADLTAGGAKVEYIGEDFFPIQETAD